MGDYFYIKIQLKEKEKKNWTKHKIYSDSISKWMLICAFYMTQREENEKEQQQQQ